MRTQRDIEVLYIFLQQRRVFGSADRFHLIDVRGIAGYAPFLQGLHYRCLVHYAASRNVDQHGIEVHLLEFRGGDEVESLGVSRQRQNKDGGVTQHIVKWHAVVGRIWSW